MKARMSKFKDGVKSSSPEFAPCGAKSEEIWKPVKDYEGLYEVSNLGRVKSFISNRRGQKNPPISNKILKQSCGRDGYLRVRLTGHDKKLRMWFVHRLVMISFVGKETDRPQVNHINGIKIDNRLENLEWVTGTENMLHAYRKGLEKPCDNGLKKHVVAIRNGEVIGEFVSIREMCRRLNLDRRSVERTMKGKYAHHHGLTFKEI